MVLNEYEYITKYINENAGLKSSIISISLAVLHTQIGNLMLYLAL